MNTYLIELNILFECISEHTTGRWRDLLGFGGTEKAVSRHRWVEEEEITLTNESESYGTIEFSTSSSQDASKSDIIILFLPNHSFPHKVLLEYLTTPNAVFMSSTKKIIKWQHISHHQRRIPGNTTCGWCLKPIYDTIIYHLTMCHRAWCHMFSGPLSQSRSIRWSHIPLNFAAASKHIIPA